MRHPAPFLALVFLWGCLLAAPAAFAAGDPDGLDASETTLEIPAGQADPATQTPPETGATGPAVTTPDDEFTEEPSFYYYPRIKLRALNKVTAQTRTLELAIGDSSAFGPIFIRPQVCQKPPAIEKPEASAFIQVWELGDNDESRWVFSGWMFASSPALSAMDHPVYDVWVIDCLGDALNAVPEKKEVAPDENPTPPADAPDETPGETGEPDPVSETPADDADLPPED